MINLLRNLQIKISKIFNLIEWGRWLVRQRREPRPIGTIVVKRRGQFMITYEVIGYMPGVFITEMLDEVSREKIIGS